MTRRWSKPLAFLTLAVCLIAPTLAHGAVIQRTFRLSNQGDASIGRIDFNVVPPGAIVPPTVTNPQGGDAEGSPLLILPESSGFDEDLLSVALGSKPGAQLLRLLFGQTQSVDANGDVVFVQTTDSDGNPLGLFQPGGILNFALTIDDTAVSTLMLQLPEPAGGLVLQSWPIDDVVVDPDPPSNNNNGPNTPNPAQIPEPLPVMLWGGLFALGFLKLRQKPRALAA